MRILVVIALLVFAALSVSCSDDREIQTPISPEDQSEIGLLDVSRGTAHWEWHQIQFSEELYSIASSELGYNIGASSGTTKFSGDGRTWFTGGWNGSTDYLAVTSLDEVYVAVGTGPVCSIRGYAIGGNPRTNQLDTLRALTWSGKVAVGVGDAGELVTTPDGLDWQRHSPICEADLYAVVWTGDSFVCGGENGVIYESTDGVEWLAVNSPIETLISGLTNTDSDLYAVTTSGEVWHKHGYNWNEEYRDERVTFRGIDNYKTKMFAIGDDACLVEKNEFGKWKRWRVDIDCNFRAVTSYDRIAIVGSNRVIIVSSDGVSWEERPAFPPFDLYGIASNGETFVAVGRHGIIQSVDGSDWLQVRYVEYEGLYTVCWANDHYVAGGSSGLVLTSRNGTDWETRATPLYGDLWSTHWTGSEIMIGGDDGKLLISDDYLAWEEITLPSTGALFGIAQSPTEMVAVTTEGKACVSLDGRDWTVTDSGSRLAGVIWTGSHFVSLRNSSVSRSPDGTHWTSFEIAGAVGLRGIGYLNNRVYVTSYKGKIFYSDNIVDWYREESGFEWTEFNLRTSLSLNEIRVIGDDVFIVGDEGVILQRK